MLVALSSANYKFPNPRLVGARLNTAGPAKTCRHRQQIRHVESGWFVSQGFSRDCNCSLQPGLLATPSWAVMASLGSWKRLTSGVASRTELRPPGTWIINKKWTVSCSFQLAEEYE